MLAVTCTGVCCPDASLLSQRYTAVLQVSPAVNTELRQQLEDMGFSANK